MENELVKETKSICKGVYDALKEKHAELKASGASVKILNEVVADMKEAIRIYNDVNEENVDVLNAQAIDLQTVTEFRYFTEEETPELEETHEEPTRTETEEETEVGERHVGAGAVALGLVGATLLTGIAVHTGMEVKKVRDAEATTETVEESETPVRVITKQNDEETSKEETSTEEKTTEE